jgi:hypothetical protein
MSETLIIIISILILIILVVIGFGIYYIRAIKNIKIKKTKITGVTDISLDCFTIHSDIYVHNPSRFIIAVKRINYSVSFNEYRSEGTIDKPTLKSKSTNIIKVSQSLDWHMSSEVANNLINMKKTYATLEGDIIIIEKPILIKKHFSQQIELTEIIKKVIIKEVKKAAKKVKKVVNNVIDKISTVGKEITDKIKGLLD